MTRRQPIDPKRPSEPVPVEHPAPDLWWGLALGSPGKSAARRLAGHRLDCPACAQKAVGAQRLARARGILDLETPPAASRRRARKLFAATRMVVNPAASPLPAERPRSFARLRVIPGFAANAAVAGGGSFVASPALRRAGAEPLRRCALEGGRWRLELEWTPLDRAWAIRGRVVDLAASAKRGDGPAVRLESGGGGDHPVTVGPRGFFGPLRVSAPELRVTLEDEGRSFRSPWLPRAPRSRSSA